LNLAGGTAALGPVLQICLIDLLLSGDNALVIAMASRGLPPGLWRRVVVLGTIAAIVLRVLLTAGATVVLAVPFLKLAGAALLLVIAVRLLADDAQPAGQAAMVPGEHGVWKAISTIIAADTVMSLDNVVAVAAAARGSLVLLAFGLLLSIPILVFGSVLVSRLLQRYPILVLAGAVQLGWVAGSTAMSDPAIAPWLSRQWPWLPLSAHFAGAIYVLLHGLVARRRRG